MSKKQKKEFKPFQDEIAHLYPELHKTDNPNSLKNADHIMSRSVTFQVTDACNLACTYCYQCNKGTRRMSKEIAEKYVDMLLDDEMCGDYINPRISPFVVLEFIGGEPFLEIELIEHIIKYFQKRTIELQHPWAGRYMISICSNGVLYRDKKVQQFLQKYKNKMSFSVTLDGTRELHDACRIFPNTGEGSYDLALDACNDWIRRGNYMGSKITIAPQNILYVNEALQHMVELGYEEINANCVYEEGWSEEHAGELYKQMKAFSDYLLENDLENKIFCSLYEEHFFKPKNPDDLQLWCGGDGMMLSCDPDGWLYPCIRYMESSLGDDVPPIRIGHVDYGIGKTPEEIKNIHCMDCITRRTMSNDECFNCPIAEGCSWCAAYNYQCHGDLDSRATYICPMHKARALANVYFWNKKYIKEGLAKRKENHVPAEWGIPIVGQKEFNYLQELSETKGDKNE